MSAFKIDGKKDSMDVTLSPESRFKVMKAMKLKNLKDIIKLHMQKRERKRDLTLPQIHCQEQQLDSPFYA